MPGRATLASLLRHRKKQCYRVGFWTQRLETAEAGCSDSSLLAVGRKKPLCDNIQRERFACRAGRACKSEDLALRLPAIRETRTFFGVGVPRLSDIHKNHPRNVSCGDGRICHAGKAVTNHAGRGRRAPHMPASRKTRTLSALVSPSARRQEAHGSSDCNGNSQ